MDARKLAYKFRGQDQIVYALDIILNQRLYCASWSMLNDPLEGVFSTMILEGIESAARASRMVEEERSHLRVCSLSTSHDFVPLWAYYASGFTGLAIEVEIPYEAEEVKHIRYTNHVSLGTLPHDDPRQAAFESLSMKREEWQHEQEVRIILDNRNALAAPYYPLASPVRRILIGERMEPALRDTLGTVSKDRGIRICEARVGRNGVTLKEIHL